VNARGGWIHPIYRCTPSIVWVRDTGQTLAVDEETGQSWTLRGVEAVVWDLLTVGYAYRRIVTLLALIFSLSTAEAEQTLASLLRRWQETELVRVSEEAKDGESDHQCSV
jgi:hypothetical protein